MRSDVKRLILTSVSLLLQELTRDQWGRAWSDSSTAQIATDFANIVERAVDDLVEVTTPQDIADQAAHAKIQKAWWEANDLWKKTDNATTVFRRFCRGLNAAFERKLY